MIEQRHVKTPVVEYRNRPPFPPAASSARQAGPPSVPSAPLKVEVSSSAVLPRLKPGVVELDPKPSGPAYGILAAEVLHDLAEKAHVTGEYETWKETLARGPGPSIARLAYEAVEGARMTPDLIARGAQAAYARLNSAK